MGTRPVQSSIYGYIYVSTVRSSFDREDFFALARVRACAVTAPRTADGGVEPLADQLSLSMWCWERGPSRRRDALPASGLAHPLLPHRLRDRSPPPMQRRGRAALATLATLPANHASAAATAWCLTARCPRFLARTLAHCRLFALAAWRAVAWFGPLGRRSSWWLPRPPERGAGGGRHGVGLVRWQRSLRAWRLSRVRAVPR